MTEAQNINFAIKSETITIHDINVVDGKLNISISAELDQEAMAKQMTELLTSSFLASHSADAVPSPSEEPVEVKPVAEEEVVEDVEPTVVEPKKVEADVEPIVEPEKIEPEVSSEVEPEVVEAAKTEAVTEPIIEAKKVETNAFDKIEPEFIEPKKVESEEVVENVIMPDAVEVAPEECIVSDLDTLASLEETFVADLSSDILEDEDSVEIDDSAHQENEDEIDLSDEALQRVTWSEVEGINLETPVGTVDTLIPDEDVLIADIDESAIEPVQKLVTEETIPEAAIEKEEPVEEEVVERITWDEPVREEPKSTEKSEMKTKAPEVAQDERYGAPEPSIEWGAVDSKDLEKPDSAADVEAPVKEEPRQEEIVKKEVEPEAEKEQELEESSEASAEEEDLEDDSIEEDKDTDFDEESEEEKPSEVDDTPPDIPTPSQSPLLVKFVCPKCKTPGAQETTKIGAVVTCSNCGKAMRLTLKK